jgi:hypothetical protein
MDTYNYLSVLVSIILGLGITNLLSGFAGLVRERARVRTYFPVPFWMATLFFAHVQMWWAMFDLATVTDWTFAKFLSVLLQPVALFLTSAFILPNLSGQGQIDLKEGFFRESRWFGCGLLGMVVASVAKNLVTNGRMDAADIGAHLLFAFLSLTVIVFRSDRFHRIMAPAALVLLLAYTGLLFADLDRAARGG